MRRALGMVAWRLEGCWARPSSQSCRVWWAGMLDWQSLVRRWYADEAGAELAEWAVLTVVMVGGSLLAMIALREELGALFTRLIGQYLR